MKKFVLLASAVACVNQGIAADKLPVNKDMFFGCDSLPILFDDMSGYLCHDKSDIHKINFKGVETSAPGEMTFSGVATSRVNPDIRSMFEGCGKLETIVCKTVGKFHVCKKFASQKMSGSDTSNIKVTNQNSMYDITSMLEGCHSLKIIDFGTGGMFRVGENFTLQKISDSDTSKFTDGYV